jgi:hypothetical protein
MRRTIPALLSLACVSITAQAADYDQISRLDFNRRAVEVAAPLFWTSDADRDGALDPAELAVTWGLGEASLAQYVKDGAFTPKFAETYAQMRKPVDFSSLAAPEKARRDAVIAELGQGRPTLVKTDLANPQDRAVVEHVERAARLVERLYARQMGVFGMETRIPADDPASRALFFRNRGPFCQAPKTESNPDCNALPDKPKKVSGIYPASIQGDPKFCEALSKRKDGDALLGWFNVVQHKPGGRAEGNAATDDLIAVPYHVAYADDMKAASAELMAAAAVVAKDPAEAAFKNYLETTAKAFLTNDWYAADVAWKAMTATNSKWYLRIGPDEVYVEPCGRKSLFHVSFARINQDSLAWQRKLDPVKADMEAALAAFAGAPYKARQVGFQLPDFIDIVLNAGDSRDNLGAVVGQSLPNSGPVSETGGRTVAMTNLYTDPDSLAAQRDLAASVLCKSTLDRVDFDPRFQTMTTVLHEAAHNLGPSHEYKVDGRTAQQIFGGQLASTLEELKAQTAALYFPQWLGDRKLLTAEEVERAQLANVTWAFGHIAQGMYTADGQPKSYSQLSAIQMGFLNQKGVLNWRADQKAANGTDTGCFDVDTTKWQPVVEELARDTIGVKGRGDRATAEKIRDTWVTEGTPWAGLRGEIKERWLRAPKASFVYSFD